MNKILRLIIFSLFACSPVLAQTVISNVYVQSSTSTSATIVWTTSTASTSQIKYGFGSTALTFANNTNFSLVTSHSMTLPLLNASQPYYFAAVSTDGSGIPTQSGTVEFALCGQALVPVSGTVNFAYGKGSYTLTWNPPAGSSGPYTVCGQSFAQTVTGSLNTSGTFSAVVADALKVTPGPGTWTVAVSGSGSIGPISVTAALSAQSQDVTSQLQAAAIPVGLTPVVATASACAPAWICAGGGTGGTVITSPQFSIFYQNNPGSQPTAVGDSLVTRDAQGNMTAVSFSGAGTGLTGTAASLTAGNSNQLEGATWASPGAIGGTTPAAGTFSTVAAGAAVLSPECVEYYLTSGMAGDYGQAINAGVQAHSLTIPSSLGICIDGDHSVSTPIVIDRPINWYQARSRLIPQSALVSVPVTLSAATLTAGSTAVGVSSSAGLTVGMAIGGIGLGPENYIAAIPDGTHVTLAIPASLTRNGVVTSGNAVVHISSMKGVAVGQTVAWQGQSTPIAIDAISTANQTITLHSTSTAGGVTPFALTFAGSWTATLTAVVQTPVMSWVYNASALHNSEGQMTGGSIHGLWIADTTVGALQTGRALTGIQGVLIAGWDRFASYDITVDNILGSALILGGSGVASVTNHPTRESNFFNTQLRDSGDPATGQSTLAIMSPPQGNSAGVDEINQIGFVGGTTVFPYAEAITVGTYNTGHTGNAGPRMVWFDNNFQIEGGSHLSHENMTAPFDLVHIVQGNDISFTGVEIANPGYGKSVFRGDNVGKLNIGSSRISDSEKLVSYSVTCAGTTAVTYVSGGTGVGFNASGIVDGIGVTIDAANFYAIPVGAVTGGGSTLTLTATCGAGAHTLVMGYTGYYYQSTTLNGWDTLNAITNKWTDPTATTASLLGVDSADHMVTTGYFLLVAFQDRSGILYSSNSKFTISAPLGLASNQTGTAGQVATSAGPSAPPTWSDIPAAPYLSLWPTQTGYSSTAGQALVQNNTVYFGIVIPYGVTCAKLFWRTSVGDNTGNLYNVGIYSISGSTATLTTCNTGPVAGSTLFPAAGLHEQATVGSPNLPAGNYLVAITTNCGASCATVGIWNSLPAVSPYFSTSGGVTASAALPGTITVSKSWTADAAIQWYVGIHD